MEAGNDYVSQPTHSKALTTNMTFSFNRHTSGSTGIPKPVIYTHESIARYLRCSSCPTEEGTPSLDGLCRGKRMISTLPLFHVRYVLVKTHPARLLTWYTLHKQNREPESRSTYSAPSLLAPFPSLGAWQQSPRPRTLSTR